MKNDNSKCNLIVIFLGHSPDMVTIELELMF